MAKSTTSNLNSINFIGPLMLTLYLCIGFIPNWQAVDKIAPQWLVMSILNLGSLIYFFLKRFILNSFISHTIKSTLNLTYLGFIIWAIGSLFYAINPTEVMVNLGRQFNVFLMFFSMAIFFNSVKNKLLFISWIITLIFGVEVYVILNQALEMINANGNIDPGALKGVTANRNITAFSLATKIPFILFLINTIKITWKKWALATLLTLALISLSMIQSRASFLAVGAILIAYILLNIFLYFKVNKKREQLAQTIFFIIPFLLTILVNQALLSNRGANAVSRAATISLTTNDSSIAQRLRYYEDVLTHITANPFLGVGLGNWKLKSIDYDAKDINGYIVPYHAHSDFIQLGAELGILGFLLYSGIFIWALIYVYRLLKNSNLKSEKKVFLFLTLTSLGVYSVDANLNFPIARPQVLVVWTLILAVITTFYQNEQKKSLKTRLSKQQTNYFLIWALLLLLPSIYINNSVYKSLKGQMILLQDFNSNQFSL
jgi:O-antigen ligase